MSGAAFRAGVEAGDIEAMLACLSEDVVLHSPASFKPFEGKPAVKQLFTILMEHAFQDFAYTDQLTAADGTEALIFRARVGDRDVQGMDLMRFRDDGLCHDFTVMVRPLSGLNAVLEIVGAKLMEGVGS